MKSKAKHRPYMVKFSTERGEVDRLHKNGDWVVCLEEDPDYWIEAFATKKEAVSFLRKITG